MKFVYSFLEYLFQTLCYSCMIHSIGNNNKKLVKIFTGDEKS